MAVSTVYQLRSLRRWWSRNVGVQAGCFAICLPCRPPFCAGFPTCVALNRIALQGAATEPAVFRDLFFSYDGIEIIIFVCCRWLRVLRVRLFACTLDCRNQLPHRQPTIGDC